MKREIIQAGVRVMEARAAHVGASLAELYSPGKIPADLWGAHVILDGLVDHAFGARGVVEDDEHREEILFENYRFLTKREAALEKTQRRRCRA
jgi:hypothetical protein